MAPPRGGRGAGGFRVLGGGKGGDAVNAGRGGRGRGRGKGGKGGATGGDWTCRRCETEGNFASRRECHRCGAPRGAAPSKNAVARADPKVVSKHAKTLRKRLCEKGEAVRLLELLDQTCLALGVRYLDELGLRIQDVDELRALRHLEGLVELQISAFVESRFVATLFDLEAELVSVHGLRESFDELRLGPLLQQPLVGSKFLPDPALRTIPQLSLGDVLKGLHRYRTETKNFKNVELVAFLNWLAAKRGASSPRSLCVAVNKYAIGSMIKFSGKAGRDAKAAREKAMRELVNESKAEYKAELKAQEAAGKGAVRTAAVLSTAARDLAADAAGWAATDRFDVVAANLAGDVVEAVRRRPRKYAKHAAAVAELAACYALTLVGSGVDVEASRRTIEEARGLSDEDLSRELSLALDSDDDDHPSVVAALAAAEAALVERLQVPSIDALRRGSFLAFAARAPDAADLLARTVCKRFAGKADAADEEDKEAGDGAAALAALADACEEVLAAAPDSPLQALAALEAALIARAGTDAFSGGSFAAWLAAAADEDEGVRALVGGGRGGGPAPPRFAERVATAAATIGPDVLAGDGARAALAARAGVADLAALGCGADVAAFAARCTASARPEVREHVVDYVAPGTPRAAATASARDRLARAVASAPDLEDLGARLRWRAAGHERRHGDLADFCAACGVSVVVADGSVHKLRSDASFEALGAAAAAGDASTATAHAVTLMARGDAAPELLRACFGEALLRLGAEGGDVPAFVCQSLLRTPGPLRPSVADALVPALEAQRGSTKRTEADLLAAAGAAVGALHDLAVRAEDIDGARTYPLLLEDYWKTVESPPKRAKALPVAAAPIAKAPTADADADSEDGTMSAKEIATKDVENDAGAANDADAPSLPVEDVAAVVPAADEGDDAPVAVLADIRKGFGLDTVDASIDVSQSLQLQALDNALKVIARDIYSKDSHFLLELLQNADDNDYPSNATPTIVFDASPDSIVVRNNETGFRERHVRALCHVGASSKGVGGSGYIGQKGIGFKSVFRVSDRPEIHSRGYAFSLDEHMVVPTPCVDASPACRTWLAAAGLKKVPAQGTTILLPLTEEFRGEAKRAELAEKIGEIDPLLLLFLNRVRRIDVVERSGDDEDAATTRSMRRKDVASGTASVVTLTDAVGGGETTTTWLVVKREVDTVSWARRGDAAKTVLAAAFDAGAARRADDEPLPVFAFLPIAPANLAFVLHADWILASSRETVREDSAWNQWLRSEAASLYVDALRAVQAGAGQALDGFGVARVLDALPVEHEVVGFFRPLAADIARRVRGVPCVLAADGSWVLPSKALAVPERLRIDPSSQLAAEFARLDLWPLDAGFQLRLRPQTLAALGVEELDASHALKLGKALATAGRLTPTLFRQWAVLLYRAAGKRGGLSRASKAELRGLSVIPLAGGGLGCVDDAPIYVFQQSDQKAATLDCFDTVKEKLRIVDASLLAAAPARPMVLSVLRDAGVVDASPDTVVTQHVIPALVEAASDRSSKEATCDRSTVIAYWRLIRALLAKGEGRRGLQAKVERGKREEIIKLLRDAAVPVCVRAADGKKGFESRGVAFPRDADVFLAREHGAFSDALAELSTLARRLGWSYAAIDELAGPKSGHPQAWVELLRDVGCVEGPKPRPRVVSRDAWPETWAAAAAKAGLSSDAALEARDYYSETLKSLLEELSRDERPKQWVIAALCEVATTCAMAAASTATIARVGAAAPKGGALVPSQVHVGTTATVPSSVATLLAETAWLPGGGTSGAVRLFRPRDLYSPLNNEAERFGGGFAPMPTPNLRKALRDNATAYQRLGLRKTFVANDALALLETWATDGGAFETSVAHMESLYRLLASELVGVNGDAVRSFFAAKDRPCVWVPDYRYEAATRPRDRYDGSFVDDDGKLKRVPGRFYALDACVWADHSRVLDSCVHRGVEAPRVLQRHYATLQRFWCRMFCSACFAGRLGARGTAGCPHCVDSGISSGQEKALLAQAAPLESHFTIAVALAASDAPYASKRDDVLKVLMVVSFEILTGCLSAYPTADFVPHLLKGKRVWPTLAGAFEASGDDVLLAIDDDPALREALFADKKADVASAIAIVEPDVAKADSVDLNMLGIPRDQQESWLAERLDAARREGVVIPPVAAKRRQTAGERLLAEFDALSASARPLLAQLGVRPLSQLVDTKTYPEGVRFARHRLHDELASLLPHAQRWLRSELPAAYEVNGAVWARTVAGLRACVCDELEVVHSVAGRVVRVPKAAFINDGSTLYVAKATLEEDDYDAILSVVAELLCGPGDRATELTDFLVLAKSSGERLFERRGIVPLPSEETPWKAAGIEAAMAHDAPIGPPGIQDDDDDESEESEEEAAPAPAKAQRKKREDTTPGACWPPTAAQAAQSWPPAQAPADASAAPAPARGDATKEAASASRSDPHVAPSTPPPAAPEAPATSDGDWFDSVENDAAAVDEDIALTPPEPPAPPVAEAPEQGVDAARLVGELHAAFLAHDNAAELAALQELLARPAGPGDAALSEFVWPVLSAARDHDGGAPKALRSSGPAADAYAMARGRWGPSYGTGVGFDYGGEGGGGGGNGGGGSGGGHPLDLVAFLASSDLAHHAERLRDEDIESLDDLALLNREDIEACGVPAADAARIEAALAGLRLGGGGGGTGGGGGGAVSSADGATGTGPFVPRRSSELATFLASERSVSPEDATEFSRYLPHGDPTAAQQQLGRAGEALAAAYLRRAAERGELADSIGPGSWLVIWRNMGEERGEPWDVLLKGSSGDAWVEVKTTMVDDEHKPMEVSLNHLDFAREHPGTYFILRVFAAPSGGSFEARSVALYGRVAAAIETKAISLLLKM